MIDQPIISVVGARPNFMKLAPVARALRERGHQHIIVHTGQHYDPGMSQAFFDDLGIPRPDRNLEVGSSSHAQQTAAVMVGFEPVVQELNPSIVLVYGDVNSTVAAALVSAKLGVKVGHVEAGLRSNDWSMPEEINRVVTDRLSDLLFAPSQDGVDNLIAEGTPTERIHFVGNVMIDTLVSTLGRARELGMPARYEVGDGQYALVTLHRPSNVDDPLTLSGLIDALQEMSQAMPVLFAVHPRTRERMRALEAPLHTNNRLKLLQPIPYIEMLGLVAGARMVLTDSGGLQEETSYLGVPCLTVRPNTERPVTCTHGTNRLVPPDPSSIRQQVEAVIHMPAAVAKPIEKWDGKASQRIVDVLERVL